MNQPLPPKQNEPDELARANAEKLKRIVEQLRSNLYSLEEEAVRYGPLDTPLRLKNAIEQITKELGRREAELREYLRLQNGSAPITSELKRFWEPFVSEGAKFYVPYEAPDDAPGTKMQINALAVQAVFNMYRLLVELFADTHDVRQIRLEIGGVMKQDTNLKRLTAPTYPHMIVLGAPGAHPLSNHILAQFKGLPPRDSLLQTGYVFRVSGQYQSSPFIVSDRGVKRYPADAQSAIQDQGIYDLRPDSPPQFYPRTFEQYDVPGYNDHDCALIVTGWALLPGENRVRRVVNVAGHSRHSTLFGSAFVVTSEAWALAVNTKRYYNTETIVGVQPEPTGAPVTPAILAGPREIARQAEEPS
ncbi:MAG: hypothetical protein ACE5G8_13590 [Anaerolineae bacterium]